MQLNLDKYTYLISLAYKTATHRQAQYTHAWTHTRARTKSSESINNDAIIIMQ